MAIIQEKIITTWNNANKEHLKSKGYILKKLYDKVEIYNTDLQPTSPIYVRCECDDCGKIFKRQRRFVEDIDYTLCPSCSKKGMTNKHTKFCECGVRIKRPKDSDYCDKCKEKYIVTQYTKNKFEVMNDYIKIYCRDKNNKETGFFLIDLEDLDKVIKYKWRIGTGNYVIGGKDNFTRLHRYLMDCPKDREVDHVYHDTLDNRKANLKIVTHKENCANRRYVSQ